MKIYHLFILIIFFGDLDEKVISKYLLVELDQGIQAGKIFTNLNDSVFQLYLVLKTWYFSINLYKWLFQTFPRSGRLILIVKEKYAETFVSIHCDYGTIQNRKMACATKKADAMEQWYNVVWIPFHVTIASDIWSYIVKKFNTLL